MAGMVSACRVGSLLKMEMRKCGANRMTAQIVRVYTKAIRAMETAARSTCGAACAVIVADNGEEPR